MRINLPRPFTTPLGTRITCDVYTLSKKNKTITTTNENKDVVIDRKN